jgi:hypothetical protein
VTGVLGRIGAAFLAPRDPGAPDRPASREGAGRPRVDAAGPPPARSVCVLCRPRDAWPAGGAVALALLGDADASAAVVATWGVAAPALQAPAGPAARRLAARLAVRGHAATASGRLVLVAIDEVAEAARIAAAIDGEPVVRVLAGARDGVVDAVLAHADHVVVVADAPDDAVAALAAGTLDASASLLHLAAAPAARALAATGVALVAPLREQVARAAKG